MSTSTPTPSSPPGQLSSLLHRVFVPLTVRDHSPFRCEYGKKGIGDAWQNWTPGHSGINMQSLDYEWYYDWTYTYLPQRSSDPKYVRMVFCGETVQDGTDTVTRNLTEVARSDYLAGRTGRVWLVYNEPDDIDPDPKTNPCGDLYFNDPAGAARRYIQVARMIKDGDPNARVFAGGLLWLGSQETRTWWTNFIGTLRDERALALLEGTHIHLYPRLSTSRSHEVPGGCATAGCASELASIANEWYALQGMLGLENLPIWITEIGWLDCSASSPDWIRDNFMIPMAQWFDKDPAWPHSVPVNPGYDAISWYVTRDLNWFPCTYLVDKEGSGGTPTVLGGYWNSYQPR